MPRKSIGAAAALTLCLGGLSACAGHSAAPAPLPRRAGPPALATTPSGPGEFVFRGKVSPRSHGPITLHGRYRVRFAQWAPEDAHHDFTDDTSFVAALAAAAPDAHPARVRLFRQAAAMGSVSIDADGRYSLDVSFGDYPYVVRITPE